MNYDAFISPRNFLAKHLFPYSLLCLPLFFVCHLSRLNDKHFLKCMYQVSMHGNCVAKRNNVRGDPKKEPGRIYGKTFLIPLINFLVASSCWYFYVFCFRLFMLYAYKTRHVKTRKEFYSKLIDS